MIDSVRSSHGSSERRSCRVLGFRRATYRSRKAGHRPEVADEELAKLLRHTATDERYLSWGFWKIFHFLRNQGKLNDNLRARVPHLAGRRAQPTPSTPP